jgi:ribosome-binding protein aMBF1 (putative translation factor)
MSDNLHDFKQYVCGWRIFYLDSKIAGGYRAVIMKRQSIKNYKNIRDYLKGSGKTEAELAQLACISQAHVNMIKNGTRRPTPEVAAHLEAITGVSLRTLLLKVDKKSRKESRSRPEDPPLPRAG